MRIRAADASGPNANEPVDVAQVPAEVKGTRDLGHARKAPPRVRKPSPLHDQYLAPTPDLKGYRTRLPEAFGNRGLLLWHLTMGLYFVCNASCEIASDENQLNRFGYFTLRRGERSLLLS